MVTNIGLITLAPFFIAIFVPILAPNIINSAIGIPAIYIILPLIANSTKEVILLTKFSILPLPALIVKSKPNTLINKNIKKEPAPGPKKPS